MTTKPRGATINGSTTFLIITDRFKRRTPELFPPSDVALVCFWFHFMWNTEHKAEETSTVENVYKCCCFYVIRLKLPCTRTKPNTPWQTRRLQRNWEFQGASGSCGLVWGWLSGRSSGVTIFVWLSTSSGVIGVGRTSSAQGHYNITSALLTFQFPTHSLSPWPERRGKEKRLRVFVCVLTPSTAQRSQILKRGLRAGGGE